MEAYHMEFPILVIIEKADDFGKGIGEAFVRLAEKLDNNGQKRDCYGIVLKEDEGMNYYAAFTELYEGEAIEKEMSTYTISLGDYRSIRVDEWNKNILHIGPTFDQILKSGKVDTSSPCIEFYKTEQELICMVKAK
jgi:predicted transcriptional regulator YdeE